MHRLTTRLIARAASYLLIFNLSLTAVAAQPDADLILHNARIYTLDWAEPGPDGQPASDAPYRDGQWQPDAHAIALADGKILALGDFATIKQLANQQTQVIDLDGATVIPGLVDSHVHIAELGEVLQRVNLTDVADPQAALELLKPLQGTLEAGEWLIGQGWDEGAWANNYPDRHMLDALFPDNPVALRSLHGFAVWVNSAALTAAGINADSEAPVGGEIRRDAERQPTGILLNRATTLIADMLPQPDTSTMASYIDAGMRQLAQDGYVAVHEAGASAEHIAALQWLQENNALPIRMYAMLSARDPELSEYWIKRGPLTDADGFLDIRSVKAYYDGALGSRGARLLADYSDRPGHRGVSGDGYGFDGELVSRLIDAGFQVGIHAIGDAGNREVLDYLDAQTSRNTGSKSLRHRVEHAQIVHPDDFQRFAELQLVASMEPPHAVEDKTWAEQRLGAERMDGAYAWRSFREAGVALTFNSDLPGSDHNIFYGLHAAVTRRDKQQQPPGGWFPQQAVTIEEAVRGYTSWAAYSAFREQDTGVLRTGLWADLTVMTIDPFVTAESEPGSLLSGQIKMTIVDGEIVWRADAE